MDVTRRNFVKATAIAMATAAAAGSVSGMVGCAPKVNESIAGDATTKTLAVCRFCGCGCGVIVETRKGKIVSVYGDPENDSNRGLNCVKGYRCEVCYRICPLIDEAIKIDFQALEGDDIHTKFIPTIDPHICTGCGLCVERCAVSEPYVPIRIVTCAEQEKGSRK